MYLSRSSQGPLRCTQYICERQTYVAQREGQAYLFVLWVDLLSTSEVLDTQAHIAHGPVDLAPATHTDAYQESIINVDPAPCVFNMFRVHSRSGSPQLGRFTCTPRRLHCMRLMLLPR